MTFARLFCPVLITLFLLPGFVPAQVPPGWDATEFQISREELQSLLARYETVLSSPGYSSDLKEDARRSAGLIRARLEEGDFRAGDRIYVESSNPEISLPDTLLVERGSLVSIPGMGQISIYGVLRSELEEHLTREIGRFVRNPELRVRSLIRLSVQGAVGQPGYYVFPADILIGDVLMAAGGPQPRSKLDEIRIRRGEETLMRGEEVQTALDEGRSLDQLGLRAGDEINVPEDNPLVTWGQVIQWGVVIASTTLLGFAIY